MKQALADALKKRGYDTLTPVQLAVIAPELAQADLLVSAQTGSGKTVGFGLAIGDSLLGDTEVFDRPANPLALIIAPTRELALQVKRELQWLYGEAQATMASCVGGMDMRDERRALARGAHIVVATPGRLRDHIMRGSIDLSELRAVVLDEADEMLDLGFKEDLEFILGHAPETRRTLMFSATVPKSIATLAKSYQRDAQRVSTVAEKSQHTDIEYRALNVAARDVENAIINVLRFYEAPNALVFANTRVIVNRLTTRLSNRGFSVVSLSGELSQAERSHALQAMRDGRARICVATDVAARGIDLPNLDLVVHAELPSNFETLMHRSGRTGRAGRKGISALIVPPSVRRKAERILQAAKVTAQWAQPPSAEEVTAKDRARLLEDPAWHEEISAADQVAVDELLSHFSPTQVAAAFLRVYTAKQSAPEELLAVDAREAKEAKPRRVADFGPTVWFSIPGGRASGTVPGSLLPMICNAGGLTKNDIGAIKIHPDASFFEVKLFSVDGFKKALGPNMTVEDDAVVTELKAPPADVPYERSSAPKSRFEKKTPVEKPSAPIDWNDAPAPKQRKAKPGEGKPKFKSKTAAQSRPDGVVESFKRKSGSGKPGAGKPSAGKPAKKTASGKPKGGAPAGRVDKHKFDPGKPKRKSS
ncbi:MAG: DEAD/DEAH box helicase [Planktomarina sp.]|uniref:DEAD/DEAH box helicase n=1 Tax=Planktomarina sp. TaxID=2024851 RepID=UPI003260E5DD|nr:DEAD/DEAH box helicase [Planktomarina sp.]